MKIAHSMTLLATTTIAISTYANMTPQYIPGYASFLMAYNLMMGALVGCVLTGSLILLLRWWRRDRRAMTRPGHWLLVLGVAALAANTGALVAYYGWLYIHEGLESGVRPPYLVAFSLAWRPYDAGLYHQAVGWTLAAAAGLALAALTTRRLGWLWGVFFLAFGLGSCLLTRFAVMGLVDPWGSNSRSREAALLYADMVVLWSSLLVLALARDAKREPGKTPTDGLHLAGITGFLGVGMMQVLAYVRMVIIP